MKIRFALAGRIVSTAREAWAIHRQAIMERKTWLQPQARNVAKRLEAAKQF
jgi:hypothetical protein